MVNDFAELDFFRGSELIADPYPYYESLRQQCPVTKEKHHDVTMVTGWEEACAVLNDAETWSSCNSVTGPFPGFPVPDRRGRHHRADRAAPRRAAVQRPAAHARSADPHQPPLPADAADHPQAPQGERGRHVGARRPGARRIPGARPRRVDQGLRQPVHAAGHRRPAGRADGGSRQVRQGHPRALGRRRRRHRQGIAGPQPAGIPLRPVLRLRRGSPRATPATTC